MHYLEKKMWDQAIAECNIAIQFDPKYVWAFHVRGITFIEKKLYDVAIVDLQNAINLMVRKRKSKRIAIIYTHLGTAFWLQGNAEQGISNLNIAINRNNKLAIAFNNRGYMYSCLGEYEKAMEDCNSALNIDPTLYHAYVSRGHTYFLIDRYFDALKDFEKSAELKPDDKSAIAGQAICHYALGNNDKAKQLWRSLIALDATYQDARALNDEYPCPSAFLETANRLVNSLDEKPT